MTRNGRYLLLLTAILLPAMSARAQVAAGPLPPPPKFEAHRIPSVPHPGPPPIPQDLLIQRFAANEDLAKKVYDEYTFTETILVEEMSDPGGEFSATGSVYTKPDGSRYWRPVGAPESTLKFTVFSLDDVREILHLPLFFLTTAEVPNYNFLYAGQDKLDELNTYVFQVKPRVLSRTRSFFEGAVWVDDRDLAIVKTYGKFETELSDHDPKLPFRLYETYRENFQAKYWLPTYTNAEDQVQGEQGEIGLKLVVRDTDFKLAPPGQNGPPASPKAQPEHSVSSSSKAVQR